MHQLSIKTLKVKEEKSALMSFLPLHTSKRSCLQASVAILPISVLAFVSV